MKFLSFHCLHQEELSFVCRLAHLLSYFLKNVTVELGLYWSSSVS